MPILVTSENMVDLFHPPGRRWKLILGLLIVLSATEFTVRGPWRFAHHRDMNDFISPYLQSKAWVKGIDPYNPANLVRLWPAEALQPRFLEEDLAAGTLVLSRGIPTAYPLSSLVVLAPLTIFPWPIAHAAWLVINLAAFSCMGLSLAELIHLKWNETRTYIFCALLLALAPFHTGLATGSIAMIVVAIAAVGCLAAARQQEMMAGILLAIATCLKPQVALPFVLYFLFLRRWRLVGTAMGIVALIATLAVFRLTMAGTPWLESYLDDNRVLFSRGSLGDFSEANPIRFGLVNLQVPLYAMVHDRAIATGLALAIGIVAGLWWGFLVTRRSGRGQQLLALSALVVISLLPIYHRFYDASLLVFPLAWSLADLSEKIRSLGNVTLCLILPFLVPGGTLLEQIQLRGYVSAAVQGSWWWKTVIMPHQVWLILILSMVLLEAMRRTAHPGLISPPAEN
jgi:glycosyl transferase family 87